MQDELVQILTAEQSILHTTRETLSYIHYKNMSLRALESNITPLPDSS